MGWTFTWAKNYKNGKVDRKAECDALLNYTNETKTQRVLRSSMRGCVYYAAVETIRENDREIWAAVFLTTGKDRNDPFFNFGFKDMDETMNPGYYDCPKAILDLLTPTTNEWANTWRNKCRESKPENTLNKLPIGSQIKWKCNSDIYRVLVKHAPAYQFKTWFWYDPAARTYVSKKYINETNTEIIA